MVGDQPITHLVDGTSSLKIPFFHRFPVVVAECWSTWAFATDMWKSDHRPGKGREVRWSYLEDHPTVDGLEIRPAPVEVGSLSRGLQGFSTIPAGAGVLPSTVGLASG